MAYISQYEIDMQQDARSRQNQAAIGQGLVSGVEAFQENRRRALDEGRKKFENAKTYAALGVTPTSEEEKELGDTGYSATLLERMTAPLKEKQDRELVLANAKKTKALYDAEQLTKPLNERDDYIKTMEAAKIRNQFSNDAFSAKLAAKEEQKTKEGTKPIPGFEINEGYTLNEKDRDLLKTQNAAAQNIQTVGKRLLDGIDKNGITSGFGFTDADKAASQNISEMQLQLKELFNLGAITGPDMDLVNANMGKLQGPIDMLNPFNTREDAKNQIKNVINSAIQRVSGTAQARGATYLPAQQQQGVSAPAVQTPPQVQQKLQAMTPEQKMQHYRNLKEKQSRAAMAGN